MESPKNVPKKTAIILRPSASSSGPTAAGAGGAAGEAKPAPIIIQLPEPLKPGKPILIKSTSGKQMMAFPAQNPGTTTTTTVTPKVEQMDPHPTSGLALEAGNFAPQIQNGNQRFFLTTGPNGQQLIPITTISAVQRPATPWPGFAPPNPELQSPSSSGSGSGSFVFQGQGGSATGSDFMPVVTPPPQLNLSRQTPFTSSILSRKRTFPPETPFETKRSRRPDKESKGLRHFSMKVCEKVRAKGTTTYNEVADELVAEFAPAHPALLTPTEIQFDQKNIRRRVYDALNVLMAMNIISKEKKEIKWIGLPTNSMQECNTLIAQREKQIERMKKKSEQLRDLIIQQVAFRSLVQRNKEREKEFGPPPPGGFIHLPFLVASTSDKTVIDCSISQDKMEYLFNFDQSFEIHDDIEVLKRMGLALGLDKNNCTDEQIAAAKALLPQELAHYVDIIAKRTDDWEAEFDSLGSEHGHLNSEDGPFTPNPEEAATGGVGEDVDESMFIGETNSLNVDDDEDDGSNEFPVDFEIQAAIDSLSLSTMEMEYK